MISITTRQELVQAVESILLTSNVLPPGTEKIMDEMKSHFDLINPAKGLYWKETPNGVLSVNKESILFLNTDGSKKELFSLGVEDGNSFFYNHRKVWLMVYLLIAPLKAIKENHLLLRWLNKNITL